MLNRVALFRGLPTEILADNGSEFTGTAMSAWSHDHKVEHIFADPGCPTQNEHIKSFNGKLRDECLNQNWFADLGEARNIIENRRHENNCKRLHSSLNNLIPTEYAMQIPG